MSEQQRLFWPQHAARLPSGYIIGWKQHDGWCVATVAADIKLDTLNKILSVYRSEMQDQKLWENGSESLSIKRVPRRRKMSHQIGLLFRRKIRLDYLSQCKISPFFTMFSNMFRSPKGAQIVIYNQPKPRCPFSEGSISFVSARKVKTKRIVEDMTGMNSVLVKVNRQRSLSSAEASAAKDKSKITNYFDRINQSAAVEEYILSYRGLSGGKRKDSHNLLSSDPTALYLFSLAFSLVPTPIHHRMTQKNPLMWWSAVNAQVRWRYKTMKWVRRNFSENLRKILSVYNHIWLYFFDLFFGILLGITLYFNGDRALQLTRIMISSLNQLLSTQIEWFMSQPGGFKLNEDLSNFLGTAFSFYIEMWSRCTESLSMYRQGVLITVCLFGIFGGASLAVAALLDVISFLSFHVSCFYVVTARLYFLQLTTLGSLWRLFRGKKLNPLRGRIDSCDFALDQLLLGTLLFVLICFLLPTVAVYYFSFVIVRFGLYCLRGFLCTIIEILNYFPIYALHLHFAHRHYLTGGVRFEVLLPIRRKNSSVNIPLRTNNYLKLKACTAPFGILFQELSARISDLMTIYSPGRTLKYYITGGPGVKPVSHLQAEDARQVHTEKPSGAEISIYLCNKPRKPATSSEKKCLLLKPNNGIAAVKAIRSIRKWAYETFGDERIIQFVVMATPEDLRVNAEYIRMADQVEEVTGGSNANNYANVDLIVEIGERRKVQAVWAGWGHASENPRLPLQLSKTNIAFIGPPEKAMHDLGDKIASTLIAQSANVHCVGWNGSHLNLNYNRDGISEELYRSACVHTLEEAFEAIARIGYPAMIKASEGGGGKGIRKVTKDSEIESSFRQVQGEVPGSPIFIMKMLSNCRHLEVQVLADEKGNAIALYGRDCSVQRRHQKIIEEGPAIIAPEDIREEMEAAAIRITKEVGYVGVGTVEYLYSPEMNEYYFLELNPRLQVEHPVTELITDVNLPAAQLNVAMGIPLHRISDIRRLYNESPEGNSPIDFSNAKRRPPKGHVVAARITGENPAEGFKPTSGGIQELTFRSTAKVWGYFSVGTWGGLHEYADSQFGHIFSHGDDRESARRELFIALKELSIRGDISTPVAYVSYLIETDTFKSNRVTTQWLDRLIADHIQVEQTLDSWLVVLCGAFYSSFRNFANRRQQYINLLNRGQVPSKEYLKNEDVIELIYLNTKYSFDSILIGPNSLVLSSKRDTVTRVEGGIRALGDGGFLIMLGGKSHVAYGSETSNGLKLILDGRTCMFTTEYDPTKLKSSTAGKLVRHLVSDGALVKKGTPYAEIEVMKMYLPLLAQESGIITFLLSEGSVLSAGSLVATLQLEDASQVQKTNICEEGIPDMPPPISKGDKPNQILRDTISTIDKILQGYSTPNHNETVDVLLQQLMNPEVPLLECQETMSRISSKLPKPLVETINNYLDGYKAELEDMTDVPSPFSGSALFNEIHHYMESAPESVRSQLLVTLEPLIIICQNFSDGNEQYYHNVINGMLQKILDVERNFGINREESILQLRQDNPEIVFDQEFSHNNIHLKAKLISYLFKEISHQHHQHEQETGFLSRSGSPVPDHVNRSHPTSPLRQSGDLSRISDKLMILKPYIPLIQQLSDLTATDHHVMTHLCRSILIKSRMPTFERRIASIEDQILKPGNLENLSTTSDAIFDVLTNLMILHSDPAVRSACVEVYVRRSYAAFEIKDLSVNATETGTVIGHWTYKPIDPAADREEEKSNFAKSQMTRVVSDDSLAQMEHSPMHHPQHNHNQQEEFSYGSMRVINDPSNLFSHHRFNKILDDLPVRSQIVTICILDDGKMKWMESDESISKTLTSLSQDHVIKLRTSRVRRLTFMITKYGQYPKFFTFRDRFNYNEHLLYRHIDPPTASNLELRRFSNYDIQVVPNENQQIHIYYGESKENSEKSIQGHASFFAHAAIRCGYTGDAQTPHPESKAAGNNLSATDMDVIAMAENMISESLSAIEVAQGNPKFKKTWNNRIFMRFLNMVKFSGPEDVQNIIRNLTNKYRARLNKCQVSSIELVGRLLGLGKQGPLLRFVLTNPTGYRFEIDLYMQVQDPMTKKISMKSIFGSSLLNGRDPSEPYSVPDRLENNTFYVYDYPTLLEQAILTQWKKYIHERRDRGTALKIPETLIRWTEFEYNAERDVIEPIEREVGKNRVGMIAWRMTLYTPEYPSGRDIIVIANDITFQSGSFGVPEDTLFKKASGVTSYMSSITTHIETERAREEKIPRIYVAANSGARIGLASDVMNKFRVDWVDPLFPHMGYNYLYLNDEEYRDINREGKAVEAVDIGNGRWMIKDIIGIQDGLGVENLKGSAMIAGETSLAYNETFTLTFVTGRTVGIGAYLVRLGQRTIQDRGPIILTGASALNKVLGRNVYSSNLQLGGTQVMYANGISHLVANDAMEAIVQSVNWLSFVPSVNGGPLPIIDTVDPIERNIQFVPTKSPYDPRHMLAGRFTEEDEWISGFFDKGSFMESMGGWARTVVTGRARLGGIPVGVVAVETRTVDLVKPADPASPDSHEEIIKQAGQVWFPDSAYKTSQAIRDFNKGEGLPLIMFANWRGFSGGLRDLYQEILKFGSYIVDSLREYNQPIIVYIPPGGELRGGAWVVVDPSINPEMMEMYSDDTARGGILEPEGIVEIKYKTPELLRTMHRLDDVLIDLDAKLMSSTGEKEEIKRSIKERERHLLPIYERVSVSFADLQDTPGRMKAKGVIREVVPWIESRKYFYHRLKRRLMEESIYKKMTSNHPPAQLPTRAKLIDTLRSWSGDAWNDDVSFVRWADEDVTMEERLREEKKEM
ncbi:hypothetical protein PROFUN_13687 [Planoprotostelium fungivorum]|uniref:Uncharacterized protein n=1 Tax=Planoprotostelium fungivorum TaxID=1890364 RepID=A0A2P6N3D0_9EUKA|nr:hypothetical protein PROFUN_13687 [Planoprotostelium fungivorum]